MADAQAQGRIATRGLLVVVVRKLAELEKRTGEEQLICVSTLLNILHQEGERSAVKQRAERVFERALTKITHPTGRRSVWFAILL